MLTTVYQTHPDHVKNAKEDLCAPVHKAYIASALEGVNNDIGGITKGDPKEAL